MDIFAVIITRLSPYAGRAGYMMVKNSRAPIATLRLLGGGLLIEVALQN